MEQKLTWGLRRDAAETKYRPKLNTNMICNVSLLSYKKLNFLKLLTRFTGKHYLLEKLGKQIRNQHEKVYKNRTL